MQQVSLARKASTTSLKPFRPVSLRAAWVALLGCSALITLSGVASATIAQRTSTTTFTLPQALEAAGNSFCTWGFCTGISPRLYQAPMVDGRTLIGWTDANGNGHVSRVNGATIEQTFDFTGTWLRGLVVHPDNSFAVLLLVNPSDPNIFNHVMEISSLTAAGVVNWTTQLVNNTQIGLTPGVAPDPQDIGDSRLTYGNGMYAAYFAVKAMPDANNLEHNGDQLTFVNDAGVISTTSGWGWGLSHSLAELIDYQPTSKIISAVGVSDCFPGRGIFADDQQTALMTDAANCGGNTAVQLGQMAAISGGQWLVAFSGQSEAAFTDAFGTAQPAYSAQGIGVLSFNATTYAASPFTWLTNTDGTDERDPVLARIGPSLASNRFLVGWRLQNESTFNMEVINSSGTALNPLETVSPTVGWGNRDNSLASRPDGSVSWLQGAAGSTTLQLYRYAEIAPARDFNGDRTSDILWRNTNGDVVIWSMQGGKHTSSADLGVIPSSWTIAGTGDFNGDGNVDVLWRNSNGDVTLWLMNGGTIASSTDLGVIPSSWTIAGAGDFNDDGTTDILWRNSNGEVVIWFIHNGAIASSVDLGSIPAAWSIAGTGDFDGNGTSDILWRNSNGDTVIWYIQAGKIDSSADLGVVSSAWTIAATGDFNGDGKADILWRNTNGDTVIWFIQGGKVGSSSDLGVVPAAWSIAGAGDFNGDGTTDILWRNTNGDVVSWFMQNGVNSSSSADLGVVATSWAVVPPAVQ